MDTAWSLAMTCTATMVTISHWVGFTLAGMMELPGSFSGIWIFAKPQRGPLAIQRTSLAIFIKSAARALSAPWANTNALFEVSAWNLFSAETKGSPVSRATSPAASRANPFGALRPVPTAVPPRASASRPGRAASSWVQSCSTMPRQPLISWEKRMGTASWRWVRPILTTPSLARSRQRKASASSLAPGSTRSATIWAAAICMAVGKVSLELCERFTWSLGWSKGSPASALPRLATTSFTFMLDWVPLPVCQTTRGKYSSSAPEAISPHAAQMRSRRRGSSTPNLWFARAAACLSTAKARIISMGIRSPSTGKFSRLRWVCAPQ